MTQSDKLQAILKKIRALRARAADAASTEAEAAIAARKAAELLDAHNISVTELDVRADGITAEQHGRQRKGYADELFAWIGVERFCGVCVLRKYDGRAEVIGAPADVETALYFLDLVAAACASTWRAYQRTPEYRRRADWEGPRKVATAFRRGVAVRCGERLSAMAAERDTAPEASGSRALVPVKNQLIADYLQAKGYSLKSVNARVNSSAFHDGKRAGEGVSLARGIGVARSGTLALR